MPNERAKASLGDVLTAIVRRVREGAILDESECARLEREIGVKVVSSQDWLRLVERSVDREKGGIGRGEAKQD